ncbi:MAG: hypothetical protein ACLGPL_10105 [Acidobacteriota bacterium]
MMAAKVVALALAVLIATGPALAWGGGGEGLSDKEVRLLFGELGEVKSFGVIAVSLVGDAEKIGLREKDLTDHLKSGFRANFKGVPFEDISRNSGKFLALTASGDRSVGNMAFRVWVIGTEYPIVYHIRCDAGNFLHPSIYTDEILGHGSPNTTPDAIRQILDEMMQDFSSCFTRVRSKSL